MKRCPSLAYSLRTSSWPKRFWGQILGHSFSPHGAVPDTLGYGSCHLLRTFCTGIMLDMKGQTEEPHPGHRDLKGKEGNENRVCKDTAQLQDTMFPGWAEPPEAGFSTLWVQTSVVWDSNNRAEKVTRTWWTPNKGISELLPPWCPQLTEVEPGIDLGLSLSPAPPHPKKLKSYPQGLTPLCTPIATTMAQPTSSLIEWLQSFLLSGI